MMEHRQLGRSALRVSTLCLGTMNFGPRTSEPDSFAILDRAVDVGINFVDTANQYGGSLGVGATESIVGNWIARNPHRRHEIVLATKVYEPMSDGVNDRGLSARHIRQACEASLRRLNVDYIDLYQMHHIDRSAPVDEIWQAMDQLVTQGKVIYVGSSNFPGWKIAQMNEGARSRHGLGLVSEQSLYNLLERRAEMEVIPACREYGVGVITWSPLAGGVLAVDNWGTPGRRQSDQARAASLAHSERLSRYAELCASVGHPPAAVALAWSLRQPGITSTIIGPASLDQLESALGVPGLRLGDDVIAAIDAIFPPCGPAPEAYAW